MKQAEQRNTLYATTTLIFGIVCFVPLLNLLAIPLTFVFGIMSLVKISKYPQVYGGTIRTIIGLGMACLWLVISIFALIIGGPEMFIRA